MVEPMEYRVKSKEGDVKKSSTKFSKQKNRGKSNAAKCANRDVPELLRGVEKNAPDLYLKAMVKLQLYT